MDGTAETGELAGQEPQVWVCTSQAPDRGTFTPESACSVPLDDRGLRYGDGLFETMRFQRGGVPFAPRHLIRLRDGLRLLEFPELGLPDAQIVQTCLALAHRNRVVEGFVRLAVSRFGGGRGFAPPERAGWRLIAEARSLDEEVRSDAAIVCTVLPWRVDAAYPGSRLKSSSALDKVIAAQYAQAAGADEALFLNTRDELVEGTRSNVFLVRDGEVLTPGLSSGPLPGIARQVVLELLRQHSIAVQESPLHSSVAERAQEAFLTNALRGVMPVRELGGHRYEPTPGPVTQRVAALYQGALQAAVEGADQGIS